MNSNVRQDNRKLMREKYSAKNNSLLVCAPKAFMHDISLQNY